LPGHARLCSTPKQHWSARRGRHCLDRFCGLYLSDHPQRGRSVKTWGWIAALLGPLALPLIFMFPNLHRRNGNPA